jgi:dipeptide transport system permease protein
MLRRSHALAMAIPSLIGVVIVTFLLTRALPGDPPPISPAPRRRRRRSRKVRVKLGLDKPLIAQFGQLRRRSRPRQSRQLADHRPAVSERIAQPPAGFGRADAARPLVSIVIAVPLGILAATGRTRWIDHACRIVATPACRCRCSSPA